MKADQMTIEILADGTIKTTTDKISAPNHASADAFLRDVATLAGGESTRTRKTLTHTTQGQGNQQTEGH
jgi:hypothetical protein